MEAFIGGLIFSVSSMIFLKWLVRNEKMLNKSVKKAMLDVESGMSHNKALGNIIFSYCFIFFIFISVYLFLISLYFSLK
jgi:hypothetical protein